MHKKPFLTVSDQIQHLKDKGITFDLMSEEEAENYLYKNNYYFKLTSYRKNYLKYVDGENQGKYIHLDFGYLKDLAVIDMELRYLLVQLSLDIEHYAKVQLLRVCELHKEDGYRICSDFLEYLHDNQYDRLMDELNRSKYSIYCGDLYNKYSDEYPLWVFLELISFGSLVAFYGFCAYEYNDKKMKDYFYMLKTCKNIRNAAAHSNCILNNLLPNTTKIETRYAISRELSKTVNYNTDTISKKMSNARIQEIVTLLYLYKRIVTSKDVLEKSTEKLVDFKNRILLNIDYYNSNESVKTTFIFLIRVIDKWYLGE